MNILEKLAGKLYDKSQQGTDIRKLSPIDQNIYLICIKNYIQNKRHLLEGEEPELREYSDEHLVNDIVDLIHEGCYYFFIADTNNFVVVFKHHDENKLMHVVENGVMVF